MSTTLSADDRTVRTPAPTAPLGSWDWWLLGTVVGLVGFGLLMILSASSVEADARYGDATRFVSRQAVALLMGLGAGLMVVRAPWVWIRKAAWPTYAVAVFGLLLVMTPLGHDANGADRWIRLAGVNFQPSELAKLALVLVLAHYLAANEGRLRDLVGVVVPALALVAPTLLLVMMQPDFGTTVLLAGIAGSLFFVAGLAWRWVLLGGSAMAAALAGLAVVAPYRMRRLVSFMDPFADPDGAGYQVLQGWIAMANGGLTGQGLGTGLAQSGFLPEAHNDFIAAVVAEELGAIGWIAIVLAQALLVWRGTVIASRAVDLFGALMATGITVLLGAQAVVNLGVVSGWLPNKGLVLPFLSYGASAAVVHVIAVALLLRIGLQVPTRSRPRQEAS